MERCVDENAGSAELIGRADLLHRLLGRLQMSVQASLRILLFCLSACLLVTSLIQFYLQPVPPSLSDAAAVYHFLHGQPIERGWGVFGYAEAGGTNLWWILSLIALMGAVALWPGESNEARELDKLIHEWEVLDKQRKIAAEHIKGVDEGLAQSERHRFAQESLSQGERIIMSYYEHQLASFSHGQWLVIGSLALLTLIGLVGLAVHPSLTRFVISSSQPSPPGTISARLTELERGTTAPTWFMLVGLLVSVSAIAANIGISIYRAKRVSQAVIKRKLETLHRSSEQTLLPRIRDTEEAVERELTLVARLQERFEAMNTSVTQALTLGVRDINFARGSEEATLKEARNVRTV